MKEEILYMCTAVNNWTYPINVSTKDTITIIDEIATSGDLQSKQRNIDKLFNHYLISAEHVKAALNHIAENYIRTTMSNLYLMIKRKHTIMSLDTSTHSETLHYGTFKFCQVTFKGVVLFVDNIAIFYDCRNKSINSEKQSEIKILNTEYFCQIEMKLNSARFVLSGLPIPDSSPWTLFKEIVEWRD